MSKKLIDKQEFENFNLDDIIPPSHNSGLHPTIPNEYFQPSSNSNTSKKSQEIAESADTIETTDTTSSKPAKKTGTSKQRKASLQEYQQSFLIVPKITDRKTVFISDELRRSVVDVVRKLGTEKSSVSGFVENLVRNHLSEYKDDIESWKKL